MTPPKVPTQAKKFQIFLTGGDIPKIVKNPSEKDKWMIEIYSSDFYIQSQ